MSEEQQQQQKKFLAGPSRVAVEFGSFLQAQNIAGLAVGFLIASSTLDTAKNGVSSLIMPLVDSIKTLKAPKFELSNLLASLITWLVVMFVSFVIIRVAKVKTTTVPIVQVVN